MFAILTSMPVWLKYLRLQIALLTVVRRDSFAASEKEIFQALSRWCRQHVEGTDTQEVMAAVRLPLMTLTEMLNVVRPSGLLSPDDLLDAIKTRSESRNMDLNYRGMLSQCSYFSICFMFLVQSCVFQIFKWSVFFMSYLYIHLFFSLWFQSQRRTLPLWSTELRWWKGSSSLRCWTETPRTTTWTTGSPDIPLRMTAGLGSRSNWARPPSSTTFACCCGTGTAGKTGWSHPGKINTQTVQYIWLFVVNIGVNTQVKFIVKWVDLLDWYPVFAGSNKLCGQADRKFIWTLFFVSGCLFVMVFVCQHVPKNPSSKEHFVTTWTPFYYLENDFMYLRHLFDNLQPIRTEYSPRPWCELSLYDGNDKLSSNLCTDFNLSFLIILGPTPTTSRFLWMSWTGCVLWIIPSISAALGRICTSHHGFAGKSNNLTPGWFELTGPNSYGQVDFVAFYSPWLFTGRPGLVNTKHLYSQ